MIEKGKAKKIYIINWKTKEMFEFFFSYCHHHYPLSNCQGKHIPENRKMQCSEANIEYTKKREIIFRIWLSKKKKSYKSVIENKSITQKSMKNKKKTLIMIITHRSNDNQIRMIQLKMDRISMINNFFLVIIIFE